MRSSFALIVVVAALGAGCQGDDAEEAPSATVATTLTPDPAPTTSTTEAPPSAEEEVEAAYLKSWEVYADALLRLDGSRFPEVYVDDALALRNEELADLVSARTPVRIDVEHNYDIVLMDGGSQALVTDDFVNHSVLLSSTSGEPVEADPNNVARQQYQLRRGFNTWHVEHVTTRS